MLVSEIEGYVEGMLKFVTCFTLDLKGEDSGEKEQQRKSRHIKSLGPNKQREC